MDNKLNKNNKLHDYSPFSLLLQPPVATEMELDSVADFYLPIKASYPQGIDDFEERKAMEVSV